MKTEIPPSLLAAVRFLVEQRLGLRLAAHQDVSLAGALQEILARRPRIDAVSLLDRLTVEPVDGSLWQQVVARVTVGETSFFRHREWFGAIEAAVLVPLIAERRAAARRSASLWSVGCATGEEPYTLAMILHRLIPDAADWTLLLQASDVDAEALASAERGEYREWSLREIDPMARDRHFVRRRDKRSETYRLNDAIRAMVRFGYMNLADPFWPPAPSGGFDLILCRNVLMYFPPESQQRIAARLISALAPKGWIAVSPAEASAELFRPLRAVNLPDAILFQSGGQPAPAVSHTAALPAASPVPAAPPIRPDATPAHGAAYALDRAQCLANEGRHREARTLCETALAADPLSHEAHALLAAIDAEAGDLETAMQAARQGLYLKPDCPEIGFLMAGLLMRTGKPASGIRHMRRILDELEGVPDQQIVGSLDGVTARAMRELVRSALADAVFDEDESDDKSVSSRF